MKFQRKLIRIFLSLSILGFCQSVLAQSPRVFLLDGKKLAEAKQKLATKDESLKPAVTALVKDAENALRAEDFSIVKKEGTPPSGDKNDYMSQAPYFWKNPNTPNGLPYIRRDGERNPEISKYPDHDILDKMVAAVQSLSLAYYLTDDEKYAAKAAHLLRVYFLDAATKMNPHMEYAQAVPGESTGRIYGVLESRGLTRVVDSIGLLQGSKAWTKSEQQGIENWFSSFLKWLTESKNGRGEGATLNNHGTFYDIQVVSYALFLNKTEFAKNVLETAKQKRIASQIEPDGRQPHELERTKSWNYSTMNLEGLMLLAKLGENVGVDLWSYKTSDGRGIRKALDYLYPFAVGEKKWEYQQIEGWQPNKLFPLVRAAAGKYQDEEFKRMTAKIPQSAVGSRENLISQKPSSPDTSLAYKIR